MALHRRPGAISWVKQITISLEAALSDKAIDLEGAHLADVTVLSLMGAASVKVWDGATSSNSLALTEGQGRSGFDADGFSITTTGSTGGTVTLEMHGRF